MTLWIDRVINFCKWPVALFSISNLWYLLLKDLGLVLHTVNSGHIYFWLGTIVYLLIWRFFFSSRLFGSWLPTFIHECVHVLFAWCTLHRVTDFSVSWRKGGHVQYVGGEGNWLITISPYFFPLATLIALLLEPFLKLTDLQRSLLLGAVFGFEMVYVWRQIHVKQPDFLNVGLPFVWVFLPGAILFSYGMLLSHVLGLGIEGFIHGVWDHTMALSNSALQWGQTVVGDLL